MILGRRIALTMACRVASLLAPECCRYCSALLMSNDALGLLVGVSRKLVAIDLPWIVPTDFEPTVQAFAELAFGQASILLIGEWCWDKRKSYAKQRNDREARQRYTLRRCQSRFNEHTISGKIGIGPLVRRLRRHLCLDSPWSLFYSD